MVWNFVLQLVVAYAISYVTAPKPEKPKPAALSDFEFPTPEEGTPQSVVFGDVWVTDWMVLGLGNFRTRPIKSGGKK